MERTLIGQLDAHVGETVLISGSVDVRRDHGKIVFLDIRDRSGKIQVFCGGPVVTAVSPLRSEWVVSLEGKVNKRPEKMVVPGKNGDIELEATGITVLSKAAELPFEKDTEVNLDTLLDYRPYTIRSERERGIFALQATIVDAYRRSLAKQDFTEFQAPALVGEDAEGGAAVFKVDYFYDKSAYLATSPQLYKQIMVGAFERVFTIARIFRAEKSATTRHLSEITQMDFEMGYIKSHHDVMKVLERVIRDVVTEVGEKHPDLFSKFNSTLPKLGTNFPILTLAQALEVIGASPADDLDPDQERKICEWALKEHECDFVFIIDYPTKARAFYTEAYGQDSVSSKSFDLLFRGLEINSGAERIHDYEKLVARMKERKLDPEKFSFYLQAFKYGMPPHGGCSTGLERFTARMLELPNVKEASLFPRDMNRIDVLLSRNESNTTQS